jgi:hypothetical protein
LIKEQNTCQIEDYDGSAAILDVGRNEGMESLLTCSVPELHSECFIIDIDGFRYEINANSWLKIELGVPVNFR